MYKLLICDDEKYVCERLKNLIDWEYLGFELIYTAANGEEAVEIIKYQNPELLICDVRMPIMDGLQLAKYVNKFYPRNKMIIISAYDEFQYAKQAIDYGVKSYLLKPIEKEVLISTVSKVMGSENCSFESINMDCNSEDVNMIMIRKVQQYIKENYYKKISLEEAANQIYISPQYLCKKFKELTGQKFVDYVQRIKIKEARTLIKNSSSKVKDIAVKLGFDDYTYFCKVFKKHEGITPLQYRASFILINDKVKGKKRG